MTNSEIYRKNIFDILKLWSSREDQFEYQKNVPIAQVSAELFCQWEDYYADGFEMVTFLSKYEIELINEFNNLQNDISEKLYSQYPTFLPEIHILVELPEWKIINKKATEILQKIHP